jgi:hypothetical protein
MTPVLAHFGHWYVSIIYAAPALVLGGVLGLAALRDRRARRGKGKGGGRMS